MPRASVSRRWLVPAGLLLFSIGVALAVFSTHVVSWLDALIGPHPSLAWPSVPGAIIASDLGCDSEGYWEFTVRFAYDIEGRQHLGEQKLLWSQGLANPRHLDDTTQFLKWGCGVVQSILGSSMDSRREAVRGKLKYSPGQNVKVFFKPSDSRQAVIIRGALSGAMTYGKAILVYSTGIAWAAGIALFIVGVRALLNPTR